LCSERINALKGKQEDKTQVQSEEPEEEKEVEVIQTGGDDNIEINPDICTVNLDKNGETGYLDDEPGINELIDLYYQNPQDTSIQQKIDNYYRHRPPKKYFLVYNDGTHNIYINCLLQSVVQYCDFNIIIFNKKSGFKRNKIKIKKYLNKNRNEI
jgi:hypothetical protein